MTHEARVPSRGSCPSRGSWLRRPGPEADAEREELARQLAPQEHAALGSYYREGWARDAQLPPRDAPHNPWRTGLICAGRGFGKTRAGAEWVRGVARANPGARIALVRANLAEVRNVMVEGDSGVLAPARWPRCTNLRSAGWRGKTGRSPGSIRQASPKCCAGQAQKEFTLNEALARIDVLLHPAVTEERVGPPADPEAGATYLVASQATGEFAGMDGRIAGWDGQQWIFAEPIEGMMVRDLSTGTLVNFSDGWQRPPAPAEPSGGVTIDEEARAAISGIIATL